MTITPDTKDWTWVLERPCPECEFDALRVSTADVVPRLRAAVSAWPTVLATEDVRARPLADVWSPLEYGCHVRDVLHIFDGRLARMLAEQDPLFDAWDQDATAVEQRYADQDPATVTVEIADAAAPLIARYDAVAGDLWDRTGRRSDGAHFSVLTFARYLLHDLEHHVHDVTGRRAT